MEVGQYKIGAIIQARLGSTRLPNKVLLSLNTGGETILSKIFFQLKKVESIDKIVLATSINRINDKLEGYSNKFDVACYRGDEENVLSRFSAIVNENEFDYVLRFTADNPVLDVKLLKEFINYVVEKKIDYCSSKNLPIGCNFEIIKSDLIIEANQRSISSYDKEHVTPYIKRQQINKYSYEFEENNLFRDLRLTVDYPSDYSFIYLIYNMLGDKDFNLENIKSLIEINKWLLQINKTNFQKREFDNINAEITDLMPIIREREMRRIEKKLADEYDL